MDVPGAGAAAPETHAVDASAISQGLAKVRRRRWLLWGVIVGYLPGLYLALDAGLATGAMARLFWGWVGLLCVAVGMACVVKCPRCRNSFHTSGPTFLPVRRCLHCGLHVNADRKPA